MVMQCDSNKNLRQYFYQIAENAISDYFMNSKRTVNLSIQSKQQPTMKQYCPANCEPSLREKGSNYCRTD